MIIYPNEVLPEINWETTPFNQVVIAPIDALETTAFMNYATYIPKDSGGTFSVVGNSYINITDDLIPDINTPLDSGSFLFRFALKYGSGIGHFIFQCTDYENNHRFYVNTGTSGQLKIRLGDGVEISTVTLGYSQYDELIVAINWQSGGWEARVYNDSFTLLDTVSGTFTVSPFTSLPDKNQFKELHACDYLYIGSDYQTHDKLLEVAQNPYSIFQTQEDTEQEYQLVKAQGDTHELAFVNTTNASKDFDMEFNIKLIAASGSTPNQLFFGATTSSATQLVITASTLKIGMSWSTWSFTLPFPLGVTDSSPHHTYRIKLKDGVMEVWQDGVKSVTDVTGVTKGFALVNDAMFRVRINGLEFKYFKFISNDFPQDSRFWEFNQTKGDTVIDHINGAVLTLTGFPVDSGYVRGDTGVELVGYQFDGVANKASVTGLLTGSTSVDITIELTITENTLDNYLLTWFAGRGVRLRADEVWFYQNSSNSGIYNLGRTLVAGERITLRSVEDGSNREVFLDGVSIGSQPYSIIYGYDDLLIGQRPSSTHTEFILHDLTIEDITNSKSYFYDGTTGDDTKIVETINANHAIISNDSVEKWQPVRDRQVFTVGDVGNSQYDYELSSAMIDSVKNIDAIVELHIMENCTPAASIFVDDGVYDPKFIGRNPFNGDYNDLVNNTHIDGANVSSRVFLAYTPFDTKNLVVKRGGGYLIQNPKDGTRIEGCGFKSPSGSTSYNPPINSEINITNSNMDCGIDIGSASTQEEGAILNISNSVLSQRIISRDYSTVNLESSISEASDFVLSYTGTQLNVSNSQIRQDDTANGAVNDLGGNAWGVDMSTWFTDSANDDWTITEAGQTVLTGAGFNGSAICEWADAPIDVVGGDVDATITYSITPMVYTIDITIPTESTESDIGYVIPDMVYAIQLQDATVELTSDATYTISPMVYQVNMGDDIPNQDLSVSYELSPLVYLVDMGDTIRDESSTLTYNIPAMVYSVDAEVVNQVGGATVGYVIPEMVYDVNMLDEAPDTELTINYAVTPMIYNVDVGDTIADLDLDVTYVVSSPTYGIEMVTDIGSIELSVSYIIPSVQLFGYLSQFSTDFTIQIDRSIKTIQTTPSTYTIRL